MPKCTNCGSWTAHKNTLCESCVALQGNAQNEPQYGNPFAQEDNYSYNNQPASDNDYSYNDQSYQGNDYSYNNQPAPQPPVDQPEPHSPVPEQKSPFYPPNEVPSQPPFRGAHLPHDRFMQTSLQEAPGVYFGIAANINKFTTKRTRNGQVSFLSRWSNSLFKGVPFSLKPISCTLQLQLPPEARFQRQGLGEAVAVHAYLDEHDFTSDFATGNQLRVYGKPGAHGYIYANAIQNLSTNTYLNGLGGLPCWAVRTITILLLLALFCIPSMPMNFGFLPSFVGIQDTIVNVVAIVIVALIFVAAIRQSPKIRKYAIWIGITILLGMVSEGLAGMSILVGGILMLLGFFR